MLNKILYLLIISMICSVLNILPSRANLQIVKLSYLNDGTKNITASSVVNTSPEIVWKVITDYSNFTRFMPGVKKFNIIRDEKIKKLVDVKLNLSCFSDPFEYQAFITEDVNNKTVVMIRKSGDFNYLKIVYNLVPTDNGAKTIVKYSLLINHEKGVPNIIVDNILKGNTSKTINAIKKESLSRKSK